MTTQEVTGYANRRNLTEHSQETTEHKEEPKAENQESYNPQDFKEKFVSELGKINGKAAEAFTSENKLNDFTEQERQEFIDAYVTSFNNLNDPQTDPSERYKAARDTTAVLFEPIYKEVTVEEAKEAFNLDDKVVEVLTNEEIKTLTYLTGCPRS